MNLNFTRFKSEEIKLLNEVLTPKLNHEISEIDKFIKVVQALKLKKGFNNLLKTK